MKRDVRLQKQEVQPLSRHVKPQLKRGSLKINSLEETLSNSELVRKQNGLKFAGVKLGHFYEPYGSNKLIFMKTEIYIFEMFISVALVELIRPFFLPVKYGGLRHVSPLVVSDTNISSVLLGDGASTVELPLVSLPHRQQLHGPERTSSGRFHREVFGKTMNETNGNADVYGRVGSGYRRRSSVYL